MRDLITLLISAAFGIGICLLYDVFRIARLGKKHTAFPIFIEDVGFFLIAAVVTFFIQLVRCNGMIRWFVLVGELLGFVVCRVTLSVCIMKIAEKIIALIRKIFCFIKKIMRPVFTFLGFIKKKISAFFAFLMKKVFKIMKKPLQPLARIVYNKLNTRKRVQEVSPEVQNENPQMF